MSEVKKFLKLWLPVIAYAMLIFYFSSLEGPFETKFKIANIDKLIHLLEYLVFGFLLMRAIRLSGAKISVKVAILMTFLIGFLYGVTDELHQSVVPGRFATVSDSIFDSIGSLAGAIIWRVNGKNFTF